MCSLIQETCTSTEKTAVDQTNLTSGHFNDSLQLALLHALFQWEYTSVTYMVTHNVVHNLRY